MGDIADSIIDGFMDGKLGMPIKPQKPKPLKDWKTFELNRKNYFSPEAEALFLGSTSFKNWDMYSRDGCESREVAKRKGIWADKPNPAFLLGTYVHSWSSGDLPEFIANTPELFKKDGTLLAKYALGDEMINTLKSDPAMMQMLQGQKEQIFTGEIAGVPFKIQVDILNLLNAYFGDIKTTKNIYEKYWNPDTREHESFIQKYDYPLQFAIYAEILRQNYSNILDEALKAYTENQLKKFIEIVKSNSYLDGYILAVDKQEVPDHQIIYMDIDSFIAEKLQEIALKLPRIIAVRNGEVEPVRCEKCDWCRHTRRIVKPVHYLDLLA